MSQEGIYATNANFLCVKAHDSYLRICTIVETLIGRMCRFSMDIIISL